MTRLPALLLVLLASCAGTPATPERPLFRFGVIADVQYSDKEPSGARHYRSSLQRLERAVEELNRQPLAFTIQLGDFIDDGEDSLPRVLEVWRRLAMPTRHVLGNHDFALPRTRVHALLDLDSARGYYAFARDGWRFIVLDGMDVSVSGGWPDDDPRLREARAMLASLRHRKTDNAQPWNGGIGPEQLAWLHAELTDAGARDERVVLFCHFPVLEAASSSFHLLWNHGDVRDLLADHEPVVAWCNGHDHAGGYARDAAGVHHLTLHGMVEAPERNAYAIVEVWPDRLEVRGVGAQPSRTLPVR